MMQLQGVDLRQLQTQVTLITAQVNEMRERITRIEGRSELFTPFPHVHELYDRLNSRLSDVSEAMNKVLLELQSDHAEDVMRLSEAVTIGQLKIAEIQADLETLIAQSRQKRDEEMGALMAGQKELGSAVVELKGQIDKIKTREVGIFIHLKALWSRLDAAGKAYKTLATVVALAAALTGFYLRSGADIWAIVTQAAHEIGEVLRHVN